MIFKKQIYVVQPKDGKKKTWKVMTIFRIFRYANRKDTTLLILSFLAAVVSGLLSPLSISLIVTPMMMIFMENEAPGKTPRFNITEEVSQFATYSYHYFIFGFGTIISSLIQIIASEVASRNIMAKIKTEYLAKMLSIEMGWYDKSKEQFVSTVSHDLQKMRALFDNNMTFAAEMLSLLFFGCVAGFIVSWKLALLSLVLMIICGATIYLIMHESKKKGKSQQQYSEKCAKITSEVLGNARTVAAYGGEYKEIERYKSTFKMANKYGLKHATVISVAKALNYFQLCLCYIIPYYYSVELYLKHEFNPEYLSIILIAQNNAIQLSAYMFSTISDLFIATDSAYRIMQFLDTETSYNESIEQGVIPNSFEANISFRNVQFAYPTNLHTKVLHDLTLDIEPGKVTAVVGTSGAGKSTIVGLMSRLYDVSAGQVIF